MLIKLSETVVCICFCFSVTTSYIYAKTSERTPKIQVTPKMVTSYTPDIYYKQSRYSKFDKVMTRINNMNFDDEIFDQAAYKIRHKGWNNRKPITTTPTTTTTTEVDLFDTYGELVNENYLDDYEDTLDDEFEYEDEDDDLFDDIQAEEPTEKPTEKPSTLAPRPVSKFTEYKWNHFGTREKVEESMRQQLQLNPSKEQLKVKAVIDHYSRVNQQSKCHNPLPRVIPVQHEHPDPTRSYIPACTVLYRCAEDSGCCKRDTQCQYKTRALVTLYFYAKVIGQDHNTIERLEFYNHTECTCKERTQYVSPEHAKDPDSKLSETEFQNTRIEKNIDRCNCPMPYEPTTVSSKCICDCDLNQQDCIQLKKGKEHFSMTNRMCIQDNECSLPSCEYGAYMISEGKCPTKQDKLEEYRKIRIKI